MGDEHNIDVDELASFWREVASEQRSALVETRAAYLNETTALSRWLTASLLAINSGAIIAVLNADTVPPLVKVWSGTLFTIGIFFALMVAYSSLKLAHKVAPELAKQLGYWIAVNLNGEPDEETEIELADGWNKASRWRLAPDFIGWASLICFVGGLVLVGNGQLSMKIESGEVVKVADSVENL